MCCRWWQVNTCLQEGLIFLPPAEGHSDGEVDIAAKESRPEVASCPARAVRKISQDIIDDDDDDDHLWSLMVIENKIFLGHQVVILGNMNQDDDESMLVILKQLPTAYKDEAVSSPDMLSKKQKTNQISGQRHQNIPEQWQLRTPSLYCGTADHPSKKVLRHNFSTNRYSPKKYCGIKFDKHSN